jgi:hypothetical protein
MLWEGQPRLQGQHKLQSQLKLQGQLLEMQDFSGLLTGCDIKSFLPEKRVGIELALMIGRILSGFVCHRYDPDITAFPDGQKW